MSELGPSGNAALRQYSATEITALIAELYRAGAGQVDPVRLHYIEALARRASRQQENVTRLLHIKLVQVISALTERVEQARRDASCRVTRNVQRYPQAADELRQLHAAGDGKGVQQLIDRMKTLEHGSSLGTLVRQLEHDAGAYADGGAQGETGPRSELKIIRNFRHTWAKLSVDKQVTQALKKAPENAGPINSHMLVLRSLAMMRDISPDYLNRFMLYTDSLLCLDQDEKEKPRAPKKRLKAKTAAT